MSREEHKDAIEVSVVFHEGQRMFAVPKQPAQQQTWKQGGLVTLNQDPYPAMGAWFVQFWEGEEVAARVYGNDRETLGLRCSMLNAALQPPAQRTWVGLEKSDMPDGADPLFDDPKFIAGMVYAANKLMEKNT